MPTTPPEFSSKNCYECRELSGTVPMDILFLLIVISLVGKCPACPPRLRLANLDHAMEGAKGSFG